jgi:glutathione S-transferase
MSVAYQDPDTNLPNMAPAYKLTYFNGKGAAECIRFIFKYGGLEFEDFRINLEDWPQVKTKTPFGQLPLLEHDGKQINQSVCICRYLGKIVKIAGKDDWENVEIDAIVDTVNDFRLKIMTIYHEKDQERRKTQMETASKETVPFYLSRFDAIVKKNNGYLAVGRLTWADLYFASMIPCFDMFSGGDTFAKYPNLKALQNKINALPAIKKWIDQRPQTDY